MASIIATLTLSLVYGSVLAQTHVGGIPALESIHMVDALTGWAVTVTRDPAVNELLRTTDGGVHWMEVTPLRSSGRQILIENIAVLSSLIAWVESSEGISATVFQISRTVDGGRTWRNVAIPSWSAINFINTRDGWLLTHVVVAAGSEGVDIYRSTDGGDTWVREASTTYDNQDSGLPFAGNKVAITFLNTTTGWVTGGVNLPDWLYLYVTHDGGRTWRQQNLPLPPLVMPHWNAVTRPPTFFTPRDGILPVDYDVRNESGLKAIAAVVVFYATHDGGTTWTYTTPVSVTLGNGLSTSFADAKHGWVTDGTALHATRDAGHQWTTIQPASIFADVKQLDFISPRVGWAVKQTSPVLLKTLDGGHTWVPVPYIVVRP